MDEVRYAKLLIEAAHQINQPVTKKFDREIDEKIKSIKNQIDHIRSSNGKYGDEHDDKQIDDLERKIEDLKATRNIPHMHTYEYTGPHAKDLPKNKRFTSAYDKTEAIDNFQKKLFNYIPESDKDIERPKVNHIKDYGENKLKDNNE